MARVSAPRCRGYHPALHGPTVSHFTASSPEYLGWFKRWNEGKAYSEQIKPFGFLYILHLSRLAGHPDTAADPLDEADRDNDDVSPVAPFDKDLKTAVARAFDRSSPDHAPVNVDRLQTYAEMLAAYPFRAENKFLNGRPFDSGHTERRHIIATSINLIGKEADRMDEEYVLGVRGEMAIDYGGDPRQGARAAAQLRRAIAVHGKSAVAEATGVSRGTLAKIARGERATTNVAPESILAGLKGLNNSRGATLKADRAKIAWLKQVVVDEGGIRPAARRLKMDASNLLRNLKRPN